MEKIEKDQNVEEEQSLGKQKMVEEAVLPRSGHMNFDLGQTTVRTSVETVEAEEENRYLPSQCCHMLF